MADVLAHLDQGSVGVHGKPQHGLVAEILLVDHRRLDVTRELEAGAGDLVADVLGRDVDVRSQLELHADGASPLRAGAAERADAGDGVEVLLEDVGDVLLDDLGARAFEYGRNRDHREIHVRIVVDAQALIAEHAKHDQREHHHPGPAETRWPY